GRRRRGRPPRAGSGTALRAPPPGSAAAARRAPAPAARPTRRTGRRPIPRPLRCPAASRGRSARQRGGGPGPRARSAAARGGRRNRRRRRPRPGPYRPARSGGCAPGARGTEHGIARPSTRPPPPGGAALPRCRLASSRAPIDRPARPTLVVRPPRAASRPAPAWPTASALPPREGRRLRGRPVTDLGPGPRAPALGWLVPVCVSVPAPVLPRAARPRPGFFFGAPRRPSRAPAVVRVRPSRLASVVEVVRVEAPDREAVRRPPGLPPPPTHPAASAGAPPPAPPQLMSVRHVRLRSQLSALPVRGWRPRADFPAVPRARVPAAPLSSRERQRA